MDEESGEKKIKKKFSIFHAVTDLSSIPSSFKKITGPQRD